MDERSDSPGCIEGGAMKRSLPAAAVRQRRLPVVPLFRRRSRLKTTRRIFVVGGVALSARRVALSCPRPSALSSSRRW